MFNDVFEFMCVCRYLILSVFLLQVFEKNDTTFSLPSLSYKELVNIKLY